MIGDVSAVNSEMCILCGHEGQTDDAETDSVDGDWYCDVCADVALEGERPLVTDGGRPESAATSETSSENLADSLTRFQWGAIMNLGGILLIISLFDWQTASLILSFIAVLPFSVGFLMFFTTVENGSHGARSDLQEGSDDGE